MIEKPLSKLNILLVEDNEMNTLLTSAILNNAGADVTIADNGRDAIQLLRNRNFDLVLMDLHLPVMDGFETAQYIRKELSLGVPILAITANVVNGEECRCTSVGMNAFISKPYTEQELLNAITACIFSKGKNESSVAQCNSDPSSKLYSLSFLERVAKGNDALLKQMISVFIEQTPEAVNKIKYAFDKRDFGEMYSAAHRIKPDIDNLNIVSLKKDIREIEGFAAQKQNGAVLKDLIVNLDNIISEVVNDLKVKMLA